MKFVILVIFVYIVCASSDNLESEDGAIHHKSARYIGYYDKMPQKKKIKASHEDSDDDNDDDDNDDDSLTIRSNTYIPTDDVESPATVTQWHTTLYSIPLGHTVTTIKTTKEHIKTTQTDDATSTVGYGSIQGTCSGGNIRATCRDQGGICVPEPFDVNCSKGRIKPKGCRGVDCACCLPENERSCSTKIKPACSERYGSCVQAPFKANCVNGTLEKKWCLSKYCQCCVPDTPPTTPIPVSCPPPPPPVTCPPIPSPEPKPCPPPVICPPIPPPVTCPPEVTCTPAPSCPPQVTCPPPTTVACPTSPPVTCPEVQPNVCGEYNKTYINFGGCTKVQESKTESITELDANYYTSRGFVHQNGHLILKPKLGECFNWIDSVKRCQDVNSEPFIPKCTEDWLMLQDISRNIQDTSSEYNMWLPASDRGVEGVLKWLSVDAANDDPLIPWNNCMKMKTNAKPRDCVQLWSGNGYCATLDNCMNDEEPFHYYPMVCEATYNGVDEDYYFANNFTFDNGILVLKPVYGEYYTWLASIKRCRDLKSEPFIPRTKDEWQWLRIVSSEINDNLPHNLWLPLSDTNQEGTLKWVATEDITNDPLIPWYTNKVMHQNTGKKDCLQLWSGNGHTASMDKCESVKTRTNTYYPMVCEATFRSIKTTLTTTLFNQN